MCIVLFSKLYCSADIGAEVQRVSVSETAIIFCYAHPSKHGRGYQHRSEGTWIFTAI